jgi:subtilisin-like proprotein convertase family protein
VANIADVNVTLRGLSHNAPTALDVLLVSPAGQSVVLMSDLPGGATTTPACQTGASNVDLIFDDSAAGPVPNNASLVSGTYQPLDNDSPACGSPQTNDNYPNPADDPPNGTKLASFNGTDPSGDWNLFVNDSRDGGTGSIAGGWSLQISPSNKIDLGKVKKNKHKGTAKISVTVPGPGTVTLGGKGVKAQRPLSGERITAARAVTEAGTVTLPVKAKGRKKKKLNKTGKTKLTVDVTYTPAGGAANTETQPVKLVKKD